MSRFFCVFTIRAVPKFLVRNRPAPVPETFVADIAKLCELKHQFLRDFRREIREKGDEFLEAVVHAHAEDIAKRDKAMTSTAVEIIRSFLRSALA
jgi:hypothetical protein